MKGVDMKRDQDAVGTQAADAAFDVAARSAHARSLAQMSTRTSAALRQRRQRAFADQPARRSEVPRIGYSLATAVAAVLAVVIGLHMRQPGEPRVSASVAAFAPAAGAKQVTSASAAAALPKSTVASATGSSAQASNDERLDSMYDEDPDFYLWLADSENGGDN